MARVEFFEPGCVGYLICTSTDGYFEGLVTVQNGTDLPHEAHCILDVWAKEQELEKAPDDKDDQENYCLWMLDVEESFHQTQLVHVQTLLNLGDDNG